MGSRSGYLPDISINFGFFKNLAVNSLNRGEYNAAAAALYSLNGCLGIEYLVNINTNAYLKAMANNKVYLCNSCTMDVEKITNKGQEDETIKTIQMAREIPTSEIKILTVIAPFYESVLTGSTTEQVWYCPSCNSEHKMRDTNQIVPEKQKPFCIKIVPECPVRGEGISNRMGFDDDFGGWFWNFVEEINWQEVCYRKEYKNQNDGEDMEAYKDKGDEK